MKTFTKHGIAHFLPRSRPIAVLAAFLMPTVPGCAGGARAAEERPRAVRASDVVIRSDAPRPPFRFSERDEAFLDEVQRAAFSFFWNEADPRTGLIPDRTSSEVVSVAGVGFGLSALPIGVERGWITREQGEAQARLILASLLSEPTNRKAGLFYHFLNPHDASPKRVGTELVVSTIDSAILMAGAITAGQYFGGEVASLGGRLVADADWSSFADHDHPEGEGFLTLGWKPFSDDDPTGKGEILPYFWLDSGDEHRLATFMAVCSPDPDHRLDPAVYYRLRRMLGWHKGEVVWFPYSGALFTAFFAHCWIDYARLGVDDPGAWGVEHRARVDWWENSRRLVHLHRDKAIANPERLPTLGPDAWGLSACDGPDGYVVGGLFPEPLEMIGAVPGRDYSVHEAEDHWGGGVVPPYAAASSIVFEPGLSIRAMRHYRSLNGPDGSPLAWRDPEDGGYGFVDSFRGGDEPWRAADTVAIDEGPMLLLIENARTGLIWELFSADPTVRAGLARLGLAEGD